MRILTALVLIALTAQAAPSVRWVDKTGGVHETAIAKVVSESLTLVRVKLAGGEELEIPGRFLLELIREDETQPDQQRLLATWRALEAGEKPASAKPLLDRLAAEGREPWIRRRAAAARAILAVRLGEEDGLERVESFLKEHGKSLQAARVLRARAAWNARDRTDVKEIEHMTNSYWEEAVKIRKAEGPLAWELDIVLDSVKAFRVLDPVNLQDYVKLVENSIVPPNGGPDEELVAHSYSALVRLEFFQAERVRFEAIDKTPNGPRRHVTRLANRSALLLPATRCELRRELGRIHLAFGDTEKARAEFARALELARTPNRRLAVEQELKAVSDS